MISWWEVLKASKGLPVSDFYAAMWGKQIAGKYTITELEGPLPLTFNANGTALIDYRIYGNTEQTGTPTPENPIMPIGCGELETTDAHAGQYKLPILSNSTVTNIYLGEAETTRRIKKLALTGKETWSEYSYLVSNAPFKLHLMGGIRLPSPTSIYWVCSHYEAVNNSASWTSYDSCISWSTIDESGGLRFRDIRYSNLDDFKNYIAQQYAAGTPVTVWYVLANEETGVVNEPLMKIDDYADTLSMEQAGVSIPTNKGSTTLDVDTTIKPSNVYIKYKS